MKCQIFKSRVLSWDDLCADAARFVATLRRDQLISVRFNYRLLLGHMMKTVTMTFSGGAVKLETTGFRGTACQLETAEFEALLGAKTSDTPTPEASLKPQQAAHTMKARG